MTPRAKKSARPARRRGGRAAKKARWTVLTYLAAHNDLDALGRRSLREIRDVGSTPDVVHGVLYDGPGGAARTVMGDAGEAAHEEPLGAFDSGDPDRLVETARWLFERHPAERHAIVLWSHGTGWTPPELRKVAAEVRGGAALEDAESRERAATGGSLALFRSTVRELLRPERPAERAILFDDGTGHALDTIQLGRVAEAVAKAVRRPLELLGMDACLMASLEVAYEVRASVRHLVASEELVPGHSWPYAAIYGALREDPALDGAALARLAVERFVAYYTRNPPPVGDVTKVALELGRLDALVGPVDRLAKALRAEVAVQPQVLWDAQEDCEVRETSGRKRSPSKFHLHLWDLRSLAARLAQGPPGAVRDAARAVADALAPGRGPVLAEGHRGAWFDGIGGVTAYLVRPGQQRISRAYAELAFARDTEWDEMLAAYHAAG